MNTLTIPGILTSLRAEVDAGTMTIEQAAQELCRAGWTNFVDTEKAAALLRQADGNRWA